MAGNLASSVLGLIRLQVINGVFGQSAQAGAFFAALKTPQQISDLLIGGAVSGALIPTFARFAATTQRGELQRIFSTIVTLVALIMFAAVVVLWAVAPFLVPALNSGFAPPYQQLTMRLVLVLALMLPGLGVFAVTSALLYALQRSLLPALATGMYHLGVIAGALVLARWWGVGALAVGAVLGVAGQVVILVPVLRRAGMRYRPTLDIHHPAVRQLVRLYAPIALGLLVSLAMQQLDQWLQAQTLDPATGLRGGPNVAALASATMLIQFPAGIVAAAVSFAALPQLARVSHDARHFAATVRHALTLGLALMLPICIAYLTLSGPIVALLFQHHAFHAVDTARTALALRNYAWQLPFLVVEQVTMAAFFARQQPRIPLLTGIISIAAYLLVALPIGHPITMPALALANAAQHITNALLLLGMLWMAHHNTFASGYTRARKSGA